MINCIFLIIKPLQKFSKLLYKDIQTKSSHDIFLANSRHAGLKVTAPGLLPEETLIFKIMCQLWREIKIYHKFKQQKSLVSG